MTVIQKTIGRLPVNLGDYNSTRAYGKKNRVLLYGCEWESKVNNNTYAPAALNTTTGVITPDTTHWKLISGSYNTWLIDNGYQKLDASNVKDGNHTQHEINEAVSEEIGDDSTPASIKGRIKTLETNVGEGGSVDERIAAEGAQHYLKSETYTKSEVNGMITTPDQEYVTVTATDQTTAVTDVLPATGEPDTVYRVGNWDGNQYDATAYSEYAWNESTSQYIHLSTKTQIGEVFDISAYHATGGTLATYSDLNDALNGVNGGVPQSLQKGGMSVKYVDSSDNKYVQYRLMADSFSTTPSDWQGLDDFGRAEAGSNNSDLALEDETGYAIAKFKNGHIKTKNFDSENFTNVDNTSDADKPISTATQAALDTKANVSNTPKSEESVTQADLSFTDEEGNIIGGWKEGHVFAKYSPPFAKNDVVNKGLSISDKEGYVIAKFGSYFDGDDIKDRIKTLEEGEEPAEKPSLDLYLPDYIFGVEDGQVRGRNYFVSLYPEALIKSNINIPLRLDGGKKYMFQHQKAFSSDSPSRSYNIYEVSKTIKASAEGYKDSDISFNAIFANRGNAKGKNIMLLTVGDSKVESWCTSGDNYQIPEGTWPSYLAKMGTEDSAEIEDYGFGFQIRSIGTKVKVNRTWRYNAQVSSSSIVEKELHNVSFVEGRSGWTGWGFLNYPFFVWQDVRTGQVNGITGAENLYYILGLATMTPFDSNTVGRDFVAYENESNSMELIMLTPFGRFKPNFNSAIWEQMKAFTAFEGTGEYNPSTSDAIMTAFLEQIMADPLMMYGGTVTYEQMQRTTCNLFYDVNKARAYTGDHVWTYDNAFSVAAYINRCRTMDDEGNRIYFDASQSTTGTAGSGNLAYKADGTLAKDANGNQLYIGTNVNDTEAWDVCKPTHLVYCLGENDGWTYNETILRKLYDRSLNAIASYDNTIPVGYFRQRTHGVLNPADWIDEGVYTKYNDTWIIRKWIGDKVERELHPTLSISSQINYIPVFFVSSPIPGGAPKLLYDFDYMLERKIFGGNDQVHPSAYSGFTTAYEVLAWIYWTYQDNPGTMKR